MLVRLFAIVVFAWSLGRVGTANALSVELTWTRAASAKSCISLEELRARLLQRFENVSFENASLKLSGHIERASAKWTATWSLSTPRGEGDGRRELESTLLNCRELDDAMVLVGALLLEPWLEVEPATEPSLPLPATEPSVLVSEPAASSVTLTAADVPAPVRPSATLPPYELAANLAVSWRAAPRTSLGVDVAATLLLLDFLRLELGGAFFPGRSFDFGAGDTARISVGYGRSDVCPGVALGRLSIDGCLGVEFGVTRIGAAENEALAASPPTRRILFGGHLAARAQVELASGTSLRVGAFATRIANRDRFGLVDPSARFDVLYEVPGLVLTLLAGLTVRLR